MAQPLDELHDEVGKTALTSARGDAKVNGQLRHRILFFWPGSVIQRGGLAPMVCRKLPLQIGSPKPAGMLGAARSR